MMRIVEKSRELEYNTGVVVRSRNDDTGFQLGPTCGRVLITNADFYRLNIHHLFNQGRTRKTKFFEAPVTIQFFQGAEDCFLL